MFNPVEKEFSWSLDWNLLRTFMVIVENRSITRAAQALGMQQPSVSNALKRLEDQLGRRLVDRKPNYFRVTSAGERLYKECVSIFESVQRFPDLMGAADSELSGQVSIAVASHVVSPLLDEVLQAYNREYPQVVFQIGVANSQDVIRRVRQKQATLGICLVAAEEDGLQYQLLYRQFFGLFCGPGHPLYGKPKPGLKDLQGMASVSFPSDFEGGALGAVSQLRAKVKIRHTLSGVSTSLHEVRRMISAGIGIGPLPLHVAQNDVAAGRLQQLPPYRDLPAIDIFLVTHPRASLSRAERRFIDQLRQKIRDTPLPERTYR